MIDIRAKREGKQKANQISSDINNAHGKSGAELLNDLKKIKKDEGDKSFEENKTKVRELEQKAVQENPEGYRKNAIEIIKANMAKNEEEITKKVGEAGAQKRLNKIVILIEKVFTAPTPDKKSLQELKEKLSKFISSTNIYDQALYSNQKVSVQRLMKKMENFLSLNQLTNTSFPAFP
nr:5883_t:CDS:2 [Entrophospora candida]